MFRSNLLFFILFTGLVTASTGVSGMISSEGADKFVLESESAKAPFVPKEVVMIIIDFFSRDLGELKRLDRVSKTWRGARMSMFKEFIKNSKHVSFEIDLGCSHPFNSGYYLAFCCAYDDLELNYDLFQNYEKLLERKESYQKEFFSVLESSLCEEQLIEISSTYFDFSGSVRDLKSRIGQLNEDNLKLIEAFENSSSEKLYFFRQWSESLDLDFDLPICFGWVFALVGQKFLAWSGFLKFISVLNVMPEELIDNLFSFICKGVFIFITLPSFVRGTTRYFVETPRGRRIIRNRFPKAIVGGVNCAHSCADIYFNSALKVIEKLKKTGKFFCWLILDPKEDTEPPCI